MPFIFIAVFAFIIGGEVDYQLDRNPKCPEVKTETIKDCKALLVTTNDGIIKK